LRCQPLQNRDTRNDYSTAAHLIGERCDHMFVFGRRHSYAASPSQKICPNGVRQIREVICLPRYRQLLLSGRGATGKIRKCIRINTELIGQEGQCRAGDDFAALNQAAWVTERAELESQTELRVRSAACVEKPMVGVIKSPVTYQGFIISRKSQKFMPFGIRQNQPTRHCASTLSQNQTAWPFS
jgi:hypothetical protein